ncbi:MAG: hypothetical protein J5630_07330 [Bacteroidaceae bacterium]|nr:hypothetical protein [Bacteroidaceae bacterium]
MNSFRLLFVILLFAACNTVDFNDIDPEPDEPQAGSGNLTLRVKRLQQAPFATDTSSKHVNFAFYDLGGTRVKQVNQKLGDTNYGTANVQLEPGTYQMVVLVHSSDRNPTMTNLAKIQFTNAYRYTETFRYYELITVTGQPQTLDLTLDRIVALCRFVISDSIPDGVAQMKFQYTGGSGHFSAITGLGVTKSTQVVTRQVQPGQRYQVIDLYTFLHQEKGTIELTATALNTAGEEQCTREFQVSMAQNQITWLTGNFFTDEKTTGQWRVTPKIALDKNWGNEVFGYY